MKKVLITGGSGFLAENLVRRLASDGGRQISLLVRKYPSDLERLKGCEYVLGDLADAKKLRAACEGMDWVIHTAGLISYNPAKAELMRITNVEGTENVAEAAREAGVKRMLHVSSTAAIGIAEDPHSKMNEQTPFNARHLGLAYFDTKYDAEQMLLRSVEKGLDAVIVNPGSLLGAGDKRRYEKGYAGLIYKYRPPVLFHGGINFVDVQDVSRGILLALEKGKCGERYILGGENLEFGELIRRVNAILGRPSPTHYVPTAMMGSLAFILKLMNKVGIDIHMTPELIRQVCKWYLFVDSSKAEKELGYKPHRIDSAISGTIDWLKEIGRLT
jgi:dihydroflavonol-4-reductase